MLGIYLRPDEYQRLSEDARAAGFKSPASFMRALYREVLQHPDVVRKAIAAKEIQDKMLDAAARLTASYLQSLTIEELASALSGKDQETPAP